MSFVATCCTKGEAIDIGQVAFTTIMNSLSNTLFSIDFAQYRAGDGSQNFKELVEGILDDAGKINVADFFPLLRLFDPQGMRGRGKDSFQRLLKVFSDTFDERMRLRASDMGSGEACCDVLDSFLNLIEANGSAELSRHHFLHLFLVSAYLNTLKSYDFLT